MGQRILVTGAGGFIGSRLLKAFMAKAGPEVEVLGVMDSAYVAWHLSDVEVGSVEGVRLQRFNILDPSARQRCLQEFRPDTIVHLAAIGLDPATAMSPENFVVNYQGSVALFRDAVAHGLRRFVYAGSCFEYGKLPAGAHAREDQPLAPLTAYAQSKAKATEELLTLAQREGVETVVLRPFQTYGPAENANRIVPYLIRCGLEQVPAHLTKGEQVKDFVFVEDVAEAFRLVAVRPLPHPRTIYNISTGTGLTLVKLAEALDSLLPANGQWQWGARPYPDKEIMWLVGANEAFARDFGWKPTTTLGEGLRASVAWHQRHCFLSLMLPSQRNGAVSVSMAQGGARQQEAVELSILSPVYNEEANIPRLYERLTALLEDAGISFELIFSDNGSRDRSWELIEALAARDRRVRGIQLSRNFGYQHSITNAMLHASGQAVVIIDADLQDPPELILTFYEKWKHERYDVVYGIRTERRGEPLWRRGLMKAFYRLLNSIAELPIPVDAGDFRLLDRRVVDVVNAMPEQDRYLRAMVAWVGFRQTGIPYARIARQFGDSKFSLPRLMAIAVDGIVGFSLKPLRLINYAAFLLMALDVVLMGYAFYVKLTSDVVPGWTSLMIVICFFLSFNFFALGIMGEYIGRIYREVKNRPKFVIDRQVGFPESSPTSSGLRA